nr:RuBisCO long chain, Form III-b [uncultured archaeon]
MQLEYIDRKYKTSKKDLVVTYRAEPDKISLEDACEQIAAESSIGTWTDISTMSPEIGKRLKPHVFFIDKNSGIVKIAYSSDLFEEGNMPQIWSAVAGNIFGMKVVDNLRLVDIEFPRNIVKSFKGPVFGIEGIRKLLKAKYRPLCGTIIKPKVGLDEKNHARVAYEAWGGGLDIVKDDENLTSMVFNNFEKRILETLKLRDKAEAETGEKKVYMANVTSESKTMLKRARFVRDCGGEYVMVDILTLGWSALQTLIDEGMGLVIHAHRAGHAALTRNKRHGISMKVIAKTARLIGADQLHIGTVVGKMEGEREEVLDIRDSLTEDIGIKTTFPVASGGLHPGHVPSLVKIFGNDIIMQFGGGCHGHPQGTASGAKAIRQAISATGDKVSLGDYAKSHKELREALLKWKNA